MFILFILRDVIVEPWIVRWATGQYQVAAQGYELIFVYSCIPGKVMLDSWEVVMGSATRSTALGW